MKQAAATVADEIITALDKIADARGVERTKVIRWALIEYIERHSDCLFERTNDFPKEQPEPLAA